jgi:hypothetical protein
LLASVEIESFIVPSFRSFGGLESIAGGYPPSHNCFLRQGLRKVGLLSV